MTTPVKQDGTFTKSVPHNAPRFRFPFPDEAFAEAVRPIVFEQDYLQLAREYRERRDAGDEPKLGDTWPSYEENYDSMGTRMEEAVLVRESDARRLNRALVIFSRTYATVPPTRFTYESFAWRVPGLVESAIAVKRFSVDKSSEDGDTATITISENHNFEPGDKVLITYWGKREIANDETFGTEFQTAREVQSVTTRTITIDAINDPLFDNFRFAQLLPDRRDPQTQVVGSRIERRYFLVGTGDNPDFEHPDKVLKTHGKDALTIRDNTGLVTDTITSETTPSLADWNAKRAEDEGGGTPEWVTVEDSVIRRWMGPIWELSTRQAKAK